MRTTAIVLIVCLVLSLSPPLPQCEMEVFEKSNPGLCAEFPRPFPGSGFPGDGGASRGGVLGRILDGIGDALGGLRPF